MTDAVAARVYAALTDAPESTFLEATAVLATLSSVRAYRDGTFSVSENWPWVPKTGLETLETLWVRNLWPWDPADFTLGPQWVGPFCGGKGRIPGQSFFKTPFEKRWAVTPTFPCTGCANGYVPRVLEVAVAATLGRATLLAAASTAAALCEETALSTFAWALRGASPFAESAAEKVHAERFEESLRVLRAMGVELEARVPRVVFRFMLPVGLERIAARKVLDGVVLHTVRRVP